MTEHAELAKDLFSKGYNCSQAVFAAFCDETGMDREMALRLSSSFGGGMGKLREVCGAVSAMFLIAGLKTGNIDPADKSAKKQHYERIQSLAAQFEQQHETIICRKLLGLPEGKDSPVPTERDEKFYKERICMKLVEDAADIMDAFLQKN